MKKIVKYNGKTDSEHWGDSTEKLIHKKEYFVVKEYPYDEKTKYSLEGVDGLYDKCLFDDVKQSEAKIDDKVYMLYSKDAPIVGKKLKCLKIESSDRRFVFTDYATEKIVAVKFLENGIYKAETNINIYLIYNYTSGHDVYMIHSRTIPKIGEKLECFKAKVAEDSFGISKVEIGPITAIESVGNEIYKINVKDEVYFVQVG